MANERFHLHLHSESIDTATLASLNPVVDGLVSLEGDAVEIPELDHVSLVAGLGVSLTQVQLDAPSLRDLGLIDVHPFDRNALPRYPARVFDRLLTPVRFVRNEELRVNIAEDGTTTLNRVGLWFTMGRLNPVSGSIQTIRATGATTLTAEAWTQVTPTLTQRLAAGTWGVVGLAARGTTILFARLVFPGGRWRPGCLGHAAIGEDGYYAFRGGAMGVWGEFEHNQVPNVEVFASAADTAQEFYFDLVKLR